MPYRPAFKTWNGIRPYCRTIGCIVIAAQGDITTGDEAREFGSALQSIRRDRLNAGEFDVAAIGETKTACICDRSDAPFALRLVKASFHAEEDGLGGIQQLAHDTNLLFYASDEAKEGREAYKSKRKPDFAQLPKRP